ncbi:hypothetical protein [Paenibacillus campi]|uniref:hypothetical protein n=1 Tax=Paenibacillus campi TaxID=3106031 RepID=UPI002AFE9304|nr:hypothetical protein [Paenibacillus sp. SGZ-1009]
MPVIAKGENGAPSKHIQAFIDLRLLNCNLKGIYEYQTIEEPAEKKTKILIMPTDEKPESMLLTELIDEINNIISSFSGGEQVSTDDMKETLNSMGLTVLNTLRVELRQLFLYVDKSSIGEKKHCEYAFNFVVLHEVAPDESLKVFEIQKLGLAIYNTDRKKVIERMELQDIDQLLA